MANGATTLIAIGLLVLIVLIVRFILKHGSAQNGGCSGNCGSCGMGCTSAFSPERKQFEDAMRSQHPSRERGGGMMESGDAGIGATTIRGVIDS